MDKQLPGSLTIPVDGKIYSNIKSVPPGAHEIMIPTTLSSEYEFKGIDGNSFVLFNNKTGDVRKVESPFGRSRQLVKIENKDASNDKVFLNMCGVELKLVDEVWTWFVHLAP